MKAIRFATLLATTGLFAACATPPAPSLVRYPLPNNNTFPILSAVEVRGDLGTVYLSGPVPLTQGTAAAPNFGADTKAQTVSALGAIKKTLEGMGLTMGDVIKMQVFLVGDPNKGGKMD